MSVNVDINKLAQRTPARFNDAVINHPEWTVRAEELDFHMNPSFWVQYYTMLRNTLNEEQPSCSQRSVGCLKVRQPLIRCIRRSDEHRYVERLRWCPTQPSQQLTARKIRYHAVG